MNRESLHHFRKRLLEEKQEVENAIKSEEENGVHSSMQEYYSELSVYDNHPADIASETFEMEMRFNLEESEKNSLTDRALRC